MSGLRDMVRRLWPAPSKGPDREYFESWDSRSDWTADELRAALRAMEAQLAPGGALLLVHYRPKVRIQPLRGDEAHDIVAAETRLAHVAHDERGDHRLDLFEDAARAGASGVA